MSAAAKTLELLGFFSAARPEIGLTQLHGLAGRDKATTYRHLQALEGAGLVEKNPLTKRYRLGAACLSLAQIREQTVPRKASVRAPLEALASATGETAHVSIISGTVLHVLDGVESNAHRARAIIDIQTLPLHATASGVCALAFGPERLRRAALNALAAYTSRTPTTAHALEQAIDEATATGFGGADRNLDDEVTSRSAPVFDERGDFAGAVAVACVASRFTGEAERNIKERLIEASRRITRGWGGAIPNEIEALWSGASSPAPTKERQQ